MAWIECYFFIKTNLELDAPISKKEKEIVFTRCSKAWIECYFFIKASFNLFVTSKTNSPIHEFKVLQNVFKIKKGLKCF